MFFPQTKKEKKTKIEIKKKTKSITITKTPYFQYWSPAKKYVCLFFPQTKAASILGRSSGNPRLERGRPRSEKRESFFILKLKSESFCARQMLPKKLLPSLSQYRFPEYD